MIILRQLVKKYLPYTSYARTTITWWTFIAKYCRLKFTPNNELICMGIWMQISIFSHTSNARGATEMFGSYWYKELPELFQAKWWLVVYTISHGHTVEIKKVHFQAMVRGKGTHFFGGTTGKIRTKRVALHYFLSVIFQSAFSSLVVLIFSASRFPDCHFFAVANLRSPAFKRFLRLAKFSKRQSIHASLKPLLLFDRERAKHYSDRKSSSIHQVQWHTAMLEAKLNNVDKTLN